MAIEMIGHAAKLYEQARALGVADTQNVANTAVPADAAGAEFGTFMKDMMSDALGSIRHSEAVSVAATKGKASPQDVVEGVMAAELTMQTAVAVRDKLVSAYQEVMRMAV